MLGFNEPEPPVVRRVLYLHDNDGKHYTRTRALRAAGFEVIDYERARDALNLAVESQPSLIFIDGLVSHMSALEVCRQLKSHPHTRTIPVLHVSSDAEAERVAPQQLDHLPDANLREPLEPAALVAAATALIQAREAEHRRVALSERRLDWVLDAEGFAIIFFDSTGTIIDANEAFLRITGYTRAEIERRELTWRRLTPEEWVAVSEEQLRKLAATGRIGPYEKEYFLADGSRRWMLIAGRDLGDGTFAEHCVDISKRKETERQLLAAKERLSADLAGMTRLYRLNEKLMHTDSLEAGLDAILDAAMEFARTDRGNVQLVAEDGSLSIAVQRGHGPRFLEHFGLSGCQATRDAALRSRERVLIQDIRADPRLAGARDLEVMLDEGIRAVQSTPLIARGERTVGILTTYFARPHPPNDAELRMLDLLAALASDFIVHAQAEATLRESEIRFRELADSMPQLVWAADEAGSLTYSNRQWREQIGAPPEQCMGSGWGQFVDPEDRDATIEAWRRSVTTGEPYQLEHRLLTVGGGSRWFLSRGLPYRDQQGRVSRWFGTCTDIEDSKRTEERLRQAQRLESVGLLAGGIAHDFNNLLTGIMGNASMMVDELGPGLAARANEIIHSAERAATLTRQLLAYSGKGHFVKRDLDVSDAVNDMAELVQFSIPKSVDLALNVQRRLPMVRMDPGQLQQVLMNLVINAGEAIGEGHAGRVTISTYRTEIDRPFGDATGREIPAGRYVCVEVSDTGSGISKDVQSRVFEPFFTTKFVGRGLGLAAVAGIVRSQNGAITLESTPGKGSTFRVLLPAAGDRMAKPEQQRANGKPRILVVDDEDSVRDFLAASLGKQGYGVLPAADGREALAICEREKGNIDAIVLDVVMPVMGATGVLPVLRAQYPNIKILLTSGYSETEARRLSAANPGAAFIQKPYTSQQLQEAIEGILGPAKPGRFASSSHTSAGSRSASR